VKEAKSVDASTRLKIKSSPGFRSPSFIAGKGHVALQPHPVVQDATDFNDLPFYGPI
jgi:hypothetical protein